MEKRNIIGSRKRLPVSAFFDQEGMTVCLELLSSVYGESEITPVPVSTDVHPEAEMDDYLTQKYKDQVCPLFLAVEGEIIFPVVGLFDVDMFILNYQQFYQ